MAIQRKPPVRPAADPVEAFIEADLALGADEGTLEAVARLYAAECSGWLKERGALP